MGYLFYELLCGLLILAYTQTAPNLNSDSLRSTDSIRRIQLVSYDSGSLLNSHLRARRSARQQASEILEWSFELDNEKYEVIMQPDRQVFTEDCIIETDKGTVPFDKTHLYEGHIKGHKNSKVVGMVLQDGRFEGKISDINDDIFIERAEKYFTDDPKSRNQTVGYRLSDVEHKKFSGTRTCPTANSKLKSIMDNIQISKHEEESTTRHRRAVDPLKTMCELYVQADHTFYDKWGQVDTVIEQLTAYVQAVNSIYKSTDFDGDGTADNIRFVIKRLKVWTSNTDPDYPFPGNYGVEKLLEVFSAQDNFDAYCLAYTFTNRDFNDGTLGLAWTGSTDSSGGVCTRNGLLNGQLMSLNTGIVTTMNFQNEVPFAVSQLTFAHELGHNMGSGHDDEASSNCAPGDPGGNFIMFAKATDGDKPNNNKFSPCSTNNMNIIMNAKARHDDSTACFKEYSSSICGNKVVETGEQCDCGWEDECEETCCEPMKSSYDSTTYFPCQRSAGSLCSPSAGSCCSPSCTVAGPAVTCRTETSCLLGATCDGSSFTCPLSAHKANSTRCSDNKVCYQGECSSSICEAFGYDTCQCDPAQANDWSDANLCKLCCIDSVDAACKPSADIVSITISVNTSSGMPCFDYQGFCDVFDKCRALDPTGPINSLQQALFTEEGARNIVEWLKTNWYIPTAAGVGFIILMILVIKFGSKHKEVAPPESKNKVHPKQGQSPPPPYKAFPGKQKGQKGAHR